MKVPTAKKLKSGRWNVQVMVDGKRMSITADTEKEAVAEAAQIKAKLKAKADKDQKSALTVGDAIDRYIESKDAVLSPATVRGYKRIRAQDLQDIMPVKLSLLTQEHVQRAVNKMSREKSPKSVRNAHGLLSAALAVHRPEMVLRTTLPQKRHYEASIPELAEIKIIMDAAKGTKMELPLLLAVWLGLRESEIRGLTWDCIEGEYLHVKQAIVDGTNGPALKGTKTYSGDRRIRIPDYIKTVIEAKPRTGDHLTSLSGQAMYKRFSRMCEKLGLPHYRFHDLRHAAASVAMAVGVPNTYTQKRMGHKTDNMLKNVYLHTLKSKEDEYADLIDETYNNILQMELQTDEKKS